MKSDKKTGKVFIDKICNAFDRLIEIGEKYNGLFPSIIDINTNEMMTELPPNIRGQRSHDRAYLGSNLMHDHVTLKAMYAVGEILGKNEYIDAADKYLEFFSINCTNTLTGLFPWGEHSYWNIIYNKPGRGQDLRDGFRKSDILVHDHLLQAPQWLWEKIYRFNPEAVGRFAKGLDYHWNKRDINREDLQKYNYNRHAYINLDDYFPYRGSSCDFPRHGGFYLYDWTFAYCKTGDEEFYKQIMRILDYRILRKDKNGLLPYHSWNEQYEYTMAVGQTLSLVVSMLEASMMLDTIKLNEKTKPDVKAALKKRMEDDAAVYLNGFFKVKHDADKGMFLLACKPGNYEPDVVMPVWKSVYSIHVAAYMGLMCLCCYRLTKDERLIKLANDIGLIYLKCALEGNPSFPEKEQVPAVDVGLAIGLLADLYSITGDPKWLEGGLKLGEMSLSVYLDKDLPRGASNIDWYESQMLPGTLLYSLARLALLDIYGIDCGMDADYTYR